MRAVGCPPPGGRRHEIAPRYCYRHVCGVGDGASRHGRGLAVLEEKEINLTPDCASAILFSDSTGTLNRRSQKVQTPVAGIAPSHLTILRVRLTANFSSLLDWLRAPSSRVRLALFRCGLPVFEPCSLRGVGAAGLSGLSGLSSSESDTLRIPS